MRFVNMCIAIVVTAIISVGAAVFVLKMGGTDISAAKALIIKATKGSVKIVQEFQGPNNLLGFVVQGKNKEAPLAIFYVDKQAHYLFSGTLIGPKGKNLSENDFFTYIQPRSTLKAYHALSKVHWLEEGKASAPHKMYVLMDPNCIACHLFYQLLIPKIKSGQLAVRWVLVSFVKPSSLAKTQAILAAKDPVAALAHNEKNFNEKTEEGGITPLKKASAEVVAKAKANAQFMIDNKISMTPTMLYKTRTGLIKLHPGGLTGSELELLINSLSDQY